MCSFKFQKNLTRKALIVLSLVLLTSCATNTLQDSAENKNDNIEVANIDSKTGKTAEVSVEEKTGAISSINTNIIDPMADIQINAEIKKTYKNTANLIKAKRFPDAINGLVRLKGKYPQLSGTNYQMARIYILQKQYEKALEQIEESIFKNGRNYYSINLKGVILKSLGKFSDAQKAYNKAIDIYPPYSNSHLNLGVLADLYLGQPELALREYKIYMSLTSNQDKKVEKWVVEVERRIKASQ